MGLVHAAVRAAGHAHRDDQREAMQRVASAPRMNGTAPQPAPLPPGITGAEILDDAVAFSKSVIYMTDEMHDALVLAAAVTHTIDSFTTLPRLLALSAEGESGKSTLLRVIMMLGNNPWKSKPTGPGLRSKFNEREKPLVVVDEASGVFGRNGLRNGDTDLGTVLREGYEKNAQLSLSADRVTEDVSCYCVAALGGLRRAVPDDVYSRCIVWKMRPVPETVTGLRDSLDDDTQAIGKLHGQRMHQWARADADGIRRSFRNLRRPHRKLRARLRQIWGPLFAVAGSAGEDWPERCLRAFKAMALDASEAPVLSAGQMALRDAAEYFRGTGEPKAFAAAIRAHMTDLDEELYERLSDRGLAQLLTEALGPAQSMDIGNARARGYHAGPVLAAWKRLEAQLEPCPDDEPEEDEYDSMFDVITLVTLDTQGSAQ
jgi:uncharacterized protein DUF3631